MGVVGNQAQNRSQESTYYLQSLKSERKELCLGKGRKGRLRKRLNAIHGVVLGRFRLTTIPEYKFKKTKAPDGTYVDAGFKRQKSWTLGFAIVQAGEAKLFAIQATEQNCGKAEAEAEAIALAKFLRFPQPIFSDCQGPANDAEIVWIPRQRNQLADKAARLLPFDSVADFLKPIPIGNGERRNR